jgi:STE24 endopeptidase
MTGEYIKYLLLGIVVFGFVWERLLAFLNASRPVPAIPKTLDQYVSRQKLEEAKAYQVVNFRFGVFTGTVATIITVAFIYFGIFGEIDIWLSQKIQHPIFRSIVYFALIFIGSDLLSIPFDYYRSFVIEEKFGFNKTTRRTFFSDKLKGYLISLVVGGGLLATLIWLIHIMGTNFWWQFWIVSALFLLSANLFYSVLILPLFNKLTPLESGELKDKIVNYARSVSFPLENILVMDGSKRSSKANAFFSGFGKRKKIVLYDTLIEQHPPDELVAILAHEVGHYKKKHVLTGMLTSVIQTGLLLFILSQFIFNEQISLALGGNETAIHLNIIGFTMLFSPISSLLGIGLNYLSRKHEFEADHFAKTSFDGRPLAEALKTLSINSLSNINPHPWYVFVNYSHPPLLERLEKLESN